MQWAFIARNDRAGLQEDARFAAQHGFAGLEFNHWASFAKLTLAEVEGINEILRAEGVACASFGLWGWNHLAPSASERATAHAYLARLIRYGQRLGARTVVTGAGQIPGASVAEQARAFAATFPRFLEQAAAAGLEIAFYPLHGHSFLDSVEAYERVWAQGLEIKIKFDPANFLRAGQDPLPIVQRYGARIGYVHIKEHLTRAGELIAQPAAGMGDVPWGPLFAFLHEHAYRGWLSLEPHGPLWSREPLRQRMLLLSKRYLDAFVL